MSSITDPVKDVQYKQSSKRCPVYPIQGKSSIPHSGQVQYTPFRANPVYPIQGKSSVPLPGQVQYTPSRASPIYPIQDKSSIPHPVFIQYIIWTCPVKLVSVKPVQYNLSGTHPWPVATEISQYVERVRCHHSTFWLWNTHANYLTKSLVHQLSS